MGLFDAQRDKLLQQWADSLEIQGEWPALLIGKTWKTSPGSLEFDGAEWLPFSFRRLDVSHGTHLRDRALTSFDIASRTEESASLTLGTEANCAAAQLDSSSSSWPCCLSDPELLHFAEAFELSIERAVPSDFEVQVAHVVFHIPRAEPRTKSSLPKPGKEHRWLGLERVDSPAKPPLDPSLDIQTRLLMLLTPPVSTLLSDAQLTLPERPFRYQLEGIQWLMDRDSALLADEMGLGKTMQAILAARLLWKSERIQNVLVICPGYLIPNWEREIAYWWPQATDHVWKVDGPRFPAMVASAGGNYIFKLLSYELLRRHVEWTADHAAQHDLVIIDEGQAIKNAGSDTAKAVKNLRGRHNWALTGTPVENHKRNLVSLFDFIRPGTLHKDMSESDMSKKKVPYFLRRRTEEVGLQLPELLDEDLYIDLGARQREAYNQMEAAGVVELTEKGDSVRVTHVFQLIQKLQQLCNFEPISGESAKSEALVHELEEVKESGRKALVFSQFVEEPFGLRRLASVLRGKKFTLIECFGDVPATSRQGLVNRFSSTPGITAMLLNYRTGGVGLNLVAANYVFLFNRWWNPAVEEQALKRAHRIRQSERVFVRRFVCRDTIEERIVQKLAEKRRLVSAIVDDAHVTDHPEQSTGLTEEELFSLFNLQVRPKQQQKPAGPIPLTKLENMTPAQYEALVAAVYEKMGYEVERTGGSGDGGVDLRAKSVTDGGGELLAVQCKHYSGTVGVEVLRELLGAVSADSAYTRGVLVVSSRASADCHAFARDKRLMIIEGPEIQRLAEKYGVAEFFGDSSPA